LYFNNVCVLECCCVLSMHILSQKGQHTVCVLHKCLYSSFTNENFEIIFKWRPTEVNRQSRSRVSVTMLLIDLRTAWWPMGFTLDTDFARAIAFECWHNRQAWTVQTFRKYHVDLTNKITKKSMPKKYRKACYLRHHLVDSSQVSWKVQTFEKQSKEKFAYKNVCCFHGSWFYAWSPTHSRRQASARKIAKYALL